MTDLNDHFPVRPERLRWSHSHVIGRRRRLPVSTRFMTVLRNSLLAFVLALSAVTAAPPAWAGERLTVVELFTSQGCSSCPPADAMLGELAKRDDVLALSVHVDYWDYIGWKDPFAKPDHGMRQREYAKRFDLKYVYTPQMVVHGTYQLVGSHRNEVMEVLAEAERLPRVPVALKQSNNRVSLGLPETAMQEEVRVLSVFFDHKHETSIERGENSGRTLAYYNVVRDINLIAVWRGEAMSIDIPVEHAMADACAIVLQSAQSGHIIGAAVVGLEKK